ncbi:MAG: hypothetical protein HQK55_14045 [Deltaproteobacteria bacterium]|nr:hypothetical protein [Deltaproteobacteria bacterium]
MFFVKAPRTVGLIFLLSCLAWAMVLIIPERSLATTYPVTTAADDFSDAGSIRNIVSILSPGDIITFSIAGPIILTDPNPLLINSSDITITGPNSGLTINGGGATTIFKVMSNAAATISNLTIQNGRHSGAAGATGGGGITIEALGSLTLNNCVVSGNTTDSKGGGIYSEGRLTAANCTFSGNNATAGPGGGIYNAGTLNLTNCTINGNSSTSDVGGGAANDGTLSATNCTFSGNTTNSKGGGVASQGTMTLTNSTITNNTDSSGTAAGLYQFGAAPSASLLNNIIAANTGGDNVKAISGTLTSRGYNIVGENTGGYFIATDIINNNPVLGALAGNGGPTKTHALLDGSPAIDAGTCTGAPATDQRGVTRPQVGKGTGTALCDIGSFEKESVISGKVNAPPAPNYQWVAALRSAGSIPITLSGTDWDGDAISYEIVSNPAHGTLSGTPPNLTYTYSSTERDATDSFKFKVTAGVYSRTGVVDVEFFLATPTPVPAAAHDQNVTTIVNQPVNLTLTSSDWNNRSVSYTIVTAPAHGTLSGTGNAQTYTPTAAYTGYDYFTFKADNGTGRTTIGRINMMIGIGAWPPVAVVTGVSDADGSSWNGSGSYDLRGDSLTYSWTCGADSSTYNCSMTNTDQPIAVFHRDNVKAGGQVTYTVNLQVTNSSKTTSLAVSNQVSFPAAGFWHTVLLLIFCVLLGIWAHRKMRPSRI